MFPIAAHSEILLRIAGNTVSKQEFEFYCKHKFAGQSISSESLYNAFDDFLFQKLKSADMRRLGYDTLPVFRQYCKAMRGKLLKAVLLDKEREERVCRDLYRQSVERVVKSGWVKMEQITVLLPQHATKEEERVALSRVDSIYTELKRGKAFSSFSHQPDGGSWIPVTELLQEFANSLTSLSKGEFSKPFLSPLGVHILKLTDTKPCISYEEARPYFLAYIESMGEKNPAMKRDLLARWKGGTLHDEAIQMQMAMVEEKLLAACWDEANQSSLFPKASPQELENYFLQNKEHYTWEFPHFKGAVIQCADKKAASRIKKYLKKQPFSQWKESFLKLKEADTAIKGIIETGVFQIGKNAYIDKLAFKCGSLPEDQEYPYVFLMGKKMKKGPEEYSDVREEVEKDYKKEQEKRLLTSLMQNLEVEIDQDVLKTVNCCGSN